ncbi:MAG: hypothetical protein DSY40_00060 [Nautilia sp.]|nr:MAG: hypothetical protein DSY40_00060 [Nautilia sp.]
MTRTKRIDGLVNELNLDPRTKVRIKNIDVELIEGRLEEKPWLIETDNKKYVLLEEEQYDKLILLLKEILEENLELKMEQQIMAELPIDLEDVKLVVKKEMEDENIPLDTAIRNVKTKYPNLFHKLEIEDLFNL